MRIYQPGYPIYPKLTVYQAYVNRAAMSQYISFALEYRLSHSNGCCLLDKLFGNPGFSGNLGFNGYEIDGREITEYNLGAIDKGDLIESRCVLCLCSRQAD